MNRIPTRIEKHSATEMLLAWNTGDSYAVPYPELRFECPCAACVDEHTGQRILRRENVRPDVRPKGAKPVGRYAIQIDWSDGHSSGIYPYDALHSICERKGLKLS